jgi:hypothetical protein
LTEIQHDNHACLFNVPSLSGAKSFRHKFTICDSRYLELMRLRLSCSGIEHFAKIGFAPDTSSSESGVNEGAKLLSYD